MGDVTNVFAVVSLTLKVASTYLTIIDIRQMRVSQSRQAISVKDLGIKGKPYNQTYLVNFMFSGLDISGESMSSLLLTDISTGRAPTTAFSELRITSDRINRSFDKRLCNLTLKDKLV